MRRIILIICILNLFCIKTRKSIFDPTTPSGLTTTLFRLILATENRYNIFITNAAYTGNSSSADTLCNSDTSKPNSGIYKAVLVSSTRRACSTSNCSGGISENLDWVFKANTNYYQADASTLVGKTNASGIIISGSSFSITNAFSNLSKRYWTGLNADFTNSINNCSNWSSNSGAVSGATGLTTLSTTSIFDANNTCNTSNSLLCVEQ